MEDDDVRLVDCYEVVEPWVLKDGSVVRKGEILHKDFSELQMGLVRPVKLRRGVEDMTAEPGAKRSTRVKRAASA
jgi:hypothetical protein